MENVLQRLPNGARVAVVRLRSLGDCVLTTPALALLHQARPDLQLGMIVEPAFAPIFAGNPDIAEVLAPKLADIARWKPQLTLNLHGGSTSAKLTLASRAPLRAGFSHFRFQNLYNVRIPRAQQILDVDRKVHTAEHIASAMFFLGVSRAEIPRARLFATPSSRNRPYAVLHPMASAADKTWPASNFLSAAQQVEQRMGLEPLFIAGTGESLAEFDRYPTFPGSSLEDVKSLLAGASLFIGNDSGPAHMAAAFGIPVVVLFGSSDLDVWRPWRTESVALAGAPGIESIRVDEVLEAADSLLASKPASQPRQ